MASVRSGVAPIMAMQLNTASKVKLKVRMALWQHVASLEGSTQRMQRGTYEEVEKRELGSVKTRWTLCWEIS
jgi:hypothetical protein